MKKTVIRSAAILILPVLILISLLLIPSQYDKTFMGELKYKYQRLNEIKAPKIVIVGGSAMAFGVDSDLIDQNFPGYDVVNMGMYAALGSRAVLDLSLSGIHKGDIVIFAPEQDPQTLSLYFGADYCLQSCDGAFYMLPRFFTSEDTAARILAAIPGFAYNKAVFFFTGQTPDPDSVYKRSSFNEYGDIEVLLTDNVMPNGYDINTPINYTRDISNKDFFDYLNRFSKKVQDKGATFLFAYAPADKSAVEGGNPDDYHLFLSENLEFPIIGDPGNSVLDPKWFYDTNFHLNSYGKTLYTRQLIRDLKAFCLDSSVTDIQIPDVKELDTDTIRKGTVLKASEYAGNTFVTGITIDESTELIEDYAFDGCTSLKEIHIKNTDPSKIQIGQHLLDGTNANIYVPASSVSAYKTDYRFSVYAGRIFPESSD